MKKSTFWIGVGIAIPLLAAGTYFYLKSQSKETFAKTIKKYGKYTGDKSEILSFDKAFLKEWAKAAKEGNETFFHAGKLYNTQGGRAKA